MALIDTSDLLLDPDFLNALTLIHRKPRVDEFGQNILTETPFATVGSVQPASGKTLMRLPEALRVADVSSFWIQGTIQADGTSQYPDIIVFRGNRYQVQTVQDWMNYGNGFCEGTCVREKVTL